MRCPSCNKFVSNEYEVEEQESAIQGDEVTASVRGVLKCCECGEELAESTFDFVEDFEAPCKHEDEFELENIDVQPLDFHQTHDRNGKPIKSMRYRKHFYGADFSCDVACQKCKKSVFVSASDKTQASGFDQLN